MTLLSRKADYALLILSHLHGRSEGANARVIAERFSLSRPFVANILKDLAGKGYLTSHRGVKGGYVMSRPARSVTLADLLATIDENFRLTVCNHHAAAVSHDTCNLEATCPVKGPLAAIHLRLMSVLQDVTLADLFDRNEPVGQAAKTLLPLLTIPVPETTAPC
jgi:Rrf2 family transcriptional regulator, cysteine metabolism repressor